MLYFEWDEEKAAKNLRDHGVSFSAARAAVEDLYAIVEIDQISEGELRLRTIGMAEGEVVVLVAHSNRDISEEDEIARIIHARKASPGERNDYEQNRAGSSWYAVDR